MTLGPSWAFQKKAKISEHFLFLLIQAMAKLNITPFIHFLPLGGGPSVIYKDQGAGEAKINLDIKI